jgi:hypothetical protein
MRHLFCIAFLVTTSLSAQTLTQRDLTDILRLAFVESKLPKELVPEFDTRLRQEFPRPMIVVKADPNMGTELRYDDTTESHMIMFWYGEDLFLYHILYWLTPIETSRRKNKAVIKYETTTSFGRRPGIVYTCFEGELRARFVEGKWKLVKTKMSEKDCKFERW